jgi:putative transposase
MSIDNLSLAHACWNCRHHIVFAPKYRRKAFFGLKRLEIGQILRRLCEWKGIEIHEAEVCPDRVHMPISIPPKFSVSGVLGYLKGKSSPMVYRKRGEREVHIPEPRILVPRALRGHGRGERVQDRGAHPKSAEGGRGRRAAEHRLRGRPVHGSGTIRQASVGPFPQPRHAAAGARGLKSPNMENHQLGWWVSFSHCLFSPCHEICGGIVIAFANSKYGKEKTGS